jgi:hypothetical protein
VQAEPVLHRQQHARQLPGVERAARGGGQPDPLGDVGDDLPPGREHLGRLGALPGGASGVHEQFHVQ